MALVLDELHGASRCNSGGLDIRARGYARHGAGMAGFCGHDQSADLRCNRQTGETEMRKQRGFILPSPTMLMAGALATAILLLGIQTWRLDAEQKAYIKFEAGVKAVGEAQEKLTKETESKHAKIVKEKNNENTIAHTKLANVSKRLRDRDSRRGLVPPAPTGASRPDLACYARADLDNALRIFADGVGELVIEGESNTIDLNTGKSWILALPSGSPADSGR